MDISDVERIRKKLEANLTTPEMVEMVVRALYEHPEIDDKGLFEQYLKLYCSPEERHLIEMSIKFEKEHPQIDVNDFIYGQK
jgi:SOS response regulatory protein OraA/RecX